MVGPLFEFPWDNCPKKHFVRRNGWVAAGQIRKKELNFGIPAKKKKTLRLFTFCAAGAVDVFTLKLAEIISTDRKDEFSSVSFCEKEEEVQAYIRRALPGAIPFFGEFESLVLLPEDLRALAADPDYDPYSGLDNPDYNAETREAARRISEHREFRNSFPYDILNLDFCGYFYKNNEPFPGTLFQALRRVLAWQREQPRKDSATFVDAFTLLFTTSLGPDNLDGPYQEELVTCVLQNLEKYNDLSDVLMERFGTVDPAAILAGSFEEFFRLALPKIISRVILDEDWFVESEKPLEVFQFERQIDQSNDSYKMLHFVFQVRRQNPPKDLRGILPVAEEAAEAYRVTVKSLFEGNMVDVDAELDQKTIEGLMVDLENVKQLADHYRT